MMQLTQPLLALTSGAEWVAIASLKTIPLIVLVLILQKLLRKQLSAAARHLLWLGVLLSLSIPFGWTLNLNQLHHVSALTAPIESASETPANHNLNLANAGEPNSKSGDAILFPNNSASSTSLSRSWSDVLAQNYKTSLAIFWLGGVLVFLSLTIIRADYFYRLKKEAILASPKITPEIFALLTHCQRELGMDKHIHLISSSEIQSPITLGWLKPAVILPHSITQELNNTKLKHILLHELGHIKRQDIFLNWLACLINIVHWFNPLVWFACKRMRIDMEMACDALVLKHLDKSQRKGYGTTLIDISEIPRVSPKALTTLGILESHTELKERLTMIKDFTAMTIKNSIIFGIILTTTAITSLAQPNTTENENPSVAATSTSDERTDDYIDLKDFAKIAEQALKIKVLVGQHDAQKIIQINLGKEPLNYGQFLTQLKINEFTAYKSKDYIQIVTMREARNLSIPVVEKGKIYFEDEVVTDYLKTEKACSGQVLATIRPLVPQYSHLSVYEDARTLIIIDTYGNIQRIKAVIKTLEANLDAPVDCKNLRSPENRPVKTEANK